MINSNHPHIFYRDRDNFFFMSVNLKLRMFAGQICRWPNCYWVLHDSLLNKKLSDTICICFDSYFLGDRTDLDKAKHFMLEPQTKPGVTRASFYKLYQLSWIFWRSLYSFQNIKPLNSLLNKENKSLVFYYLGDRTVIKTSNGKGQLNGWFYYLGDRTVIKIQMRCLQFQFDFTTCNTVR